MTKKKPVKIEFVPGAFDQFEGTQEELDAFIAELQRMADSGELEQHSVALDDEAAWLELSPEEQAVIEEAINRPNETRH
jgi:hypothetical protein